MLRSNDRDGARERAGADDSLASRKDRLAATGLVVELALPGRLHAINGHLHNAVMLADLLGRTVGQGPVTGKTLQGLQRRTASLAAELQAVDAELKRWHALAAPPADPSRTDAQAAITEAADLLRDEALRLRARFWSSPLEQPHSLDAAPGAVVQLLVAAGSVLMQRLGTGATVAMTSRARHDALEIEFGHEDACNLGAIDVLAFELLTVLATAAGGRAENGPPLRLVFGDASGDDGRDSA
jgi:hypothetical protein